MAENLQDLIPKGRTPLIDPSGVLVTTPTEEVQEKISKYGYKTPDQSFLQERLKEKKYGESEIRASIEGALRGGTFGLSDVAFRALGVSPEELAGRQEVNPLASAIGTGLGIAGSSLLVPGGGLTGLVGKGAAKAGLAATTGLAESAIARKIAASTISGVVEGAAYGLGQSVSEAALGDPTLNAQKIWSNVGLGGLLGGAIGGGVATLGAAGRKGGSWLVGKYGRGAEVPKPSPIDLEGAITPTGKLKLEGTVDFGIPDEKLLERAKALNPRDPLNKHDLDWIKTSGQIDDAGKPSIFKKIGTEEIPTLDPMAKGQVYMGDSVSNAMAKVRDMGVQFANERDAILQSSNLTLSKKAYQKMIKDQIQGVKKAGMAGDELGGKAIDALEKRLALTENLPEKMDALQIKDRLNDIRQSGKIYTKSGGLKDDFVAKTYKKLENDVDQYLKDNIDSYKSLQADYAPFVQKSQDLEDYLDWDWKKNTSNLISDWATNRVAKPFQSALPGTKDNADLIRWLGKVGGVDFENASKANLIFGKLNPESAIGGQKGTWGARLAEGIEFLKHPTEIPGKVLGGAAKVALTGELPEFLTTMQMKEAQSILLGHTPPGSAGMASRLASSIDKAIKEGSPLFKAAGPLGQLMVPEGVTAMHYVLSHDDMSEAESKVETLIALERARNDADRQIQKSIKGIFSQEPQGQEGNKNLTKFVQTPEKHSKEWEGIGKDLSDLVNNPELLVDRLSGGIDGLESAVPQLASNLTMTATRAVQFLQQKLLTPDRKPLDGKFVPSTAQILKASKYLRIINNPYRALEEVRTGNVSRETKEVLGNVFPELYEHLRESIQSGIAELQSKGKVVPHSKRFALASFLDQELGSGMDSVNMQKNQIVMMGNKNMAPTPKGASAKHLTLPTRSQTQMQKVAER